MRSTKSARLSKLRGRFPRGMLVDGVIGPESPDRRRHKKPANTAQGCGMTEEQQLKKKKTSWYLYAALVLIVVLAIGIAGQWWIGRPKHVAEHFISLVSNNQFDEAREMMVDANSLQLASNGDVTVTATDKTTVTLPAGSRRLMSGGLDTSSTIGSFLGGPYDFEVTAFLMDTETSREYAVELDAVAIGNRIVINAVNR